MAAEATAEVYRTLYFTAQQFHLLVDAPIASATRILENDPRLKGFERKLPV